MYFQQMSLFVELKPPSEYFLQQGQRTIFGLGVMVLFHVVLEIMRFNHLLAKEITASVLGNKGIPKLNA